MSGEDAARYLAILGLTSDASPAEVKQAYRDLVNVWHPDRFGHHPRLRAKAEENLKHVNAAYAWLESHPEALSSGGRHAERPTPGAADHRSDAARRAWRGDVWPTARRYARLGPVLLVLVVVAGTFLAALAFESRRRAWIVTQPPEHAAPAASEGRNGTASALRERASRAVSGPKRWPWRGVTIAAATDAVPADVGTLVTLLGPRLNYLRLTLDGRAVAEQKRLSPDAAWSTSVAWADAMLDACREVGLVATVSLNQVPLDAEDSVTETSTAFWESAEHLAEVVRLAGELAEHFRERGAELGGYEVLPKPFVLEGNRAKVPAPWPSLIRNIVAEIRKHDAAHWVVVTPGPGGLVTGYRNFAPLEDHRLIYAADTYMPSAYTRQGLGHRVTGLVYPGLAETRYWDEAALGRSLHALRAFQIRYRVPVLIDEFACVRWAPGCGRYLSDLAGIFDTYRWGWAYFGYKQGHAWDPDYEAIRREGSPAGKSRKVGADSEGWKELRAMFARFGADPPA